MSLRAAVSGLLLASCIAGCAELPRYTPTESLAYADQGWSEGQRAWFYHASQGTKIMPYAWFLALEQPQLSLTGAPGFAEPAYLARFGFLPDPVSAANPDGLPAGFAKGQSFVSGTTQLEPVIGLTCAACHTGQIEYRGRALRVDGGPALIDTALFQSELGLALFLTDQSDIRFARFADKVLGAASPQAARDALKAELHGGIVAGQAELDRGKTLYPVVEGFGRLDAIGRGANFVFATATGDNRNFAVADAPVSYPPLWDASWFDWVQYNGSIRQPMARNVVEAMGVRAAVMLTGSPGDLYRSTVDIKNLAAIEAQLGGPHPGSGLRPPRWPEAMFGPIDRAKAARGAAQFAQLCAGCHDPGWSAADGYGQRYRQLKILPLDRVGTDPKAAANFAARQAYPDLAATTQVPVTTALKAATDHVIQRWYDDNHTPAAQRLAFDMYRKNEWRALSAYRARPLDGVWATAPYLHNGSVLSLYQLLLPAAQRQSVFYTGSREFDPVQVGFVSIRFPGGFAFDTAVPGNSNRGHEFRDGPRGNGVIGPQLTDDQRWEIVEFLKTL